MRREKISQRMKLLQDLVPGCNKVLTQLISSTCCHSSSLVCSDLNLGNVSCFIQVVGKAVMLDEIINYVQSLQRQVEVYFHCQFIAGMTVKLQFFCRFRMEQGSMCSI